MLIIILREIGNDEAVDFGSLRLREVGLGGKGQADERGFFGKVRLCDAWPMAGGYTVREAVVGSVRGGGIEFVGEEAAPCGRVMKDMVEEPGVGAF